MENEMEDIESMEISDDELFADAEIPESDWQLAEPINLPSLGGASGYKQSDRPVVRELDGDEDIPATHELTSSDIQAIVDKQLTEQFPPSFIKIMTALGYRYDWARDLWELCL
jgi:hypothetical protein